MAMEKIKRSTKSKNDELKSIYQRQDFVIDQEILDKCGLTNISLRPYQLEGVKWLLAKFKACMGSILADEMGLGKTCQAISFLAYLYGNDVINKPSLILLPLSVIHNWKNELSKFSPDLKYSTYVGSKDERERLRKPFEDDVAEGRVKIIITTYEICLKDASFLKSFDWEVVIVDEAHRLKNDQSILHTELIEFNIKHWLLLTGTPVQNNLKELYSLLSLCCRDIFKPEYSNQFLRHYDNVTANDSDIKSLIQDVILRRVKSQVVTDLPSRSEVILYHGLTQLQVKYYKAILAKDIDAFRNDFMQSKKQTRLTNILMELRKCVCHPYLFHGVEPEPFVLGSHLIEASGKLLLLDGLLRHLRSKGHKVLLFSQMTSHLDIVQDYMTLRKYSYERLDGSIRSEERNTAVNNFNHNQATFAFLLSTRAGGQGLNLTSADTVVFLDGDFNPQNDLQAMARAHRIGQKRNVKVIRLVGRHTVEEVILKKADAKLKLTSAVMSGSNADDKEDHMRLEDIIKFGLEKLFTEDVDDDDDDEVDFEEILGKSVNGEWVSENRSDITDVTSKTQSLIVCEDKASSDDEKIFDKIFEDEMSKRQTPGTSKDDGRKETRRNKKLIDFDLLEEKVRKVRGPLDAEQLERRRKKMIENAERREREKEEEKKSKMNDRKERRLKLWKQNNYSSDKLSSSSEESGGDDNDDNSSSDDNDGDSSGDDDIKSDDEDDGDDDDDPTSNNLHYVVGDVTEPVDDDVTRKGRGLARAVMVHCVDDSGQWGKGGVFTALQRKHPSIAEKYELAAEMKDLNLGDVHLFRVGGGKDGGRIKEVALLVVQSRDRNNRPRDISISWLQKTFEKLSKHARMKNASLHFPRIGHNSASFDWYSAERMMKKYFTSRGIRTLVYYFPKNNPISLKRKSDDEAGSSSHTKKQTTVLKDRLTSNLPDFMRGISVRFLRRSGSVDGSEDDKIIHLLTQHVIAYDGDVIDDSRTSPSHLVSLGGVNNIQIPRDFNGKLVNVTWLVDSMKNGRMLDEDQYPLNVY